MSSMLTDHERWDWQANPDIACAIHFHPTVMFAFATCGPCAFPGTWDQATEADLAAVAHALQYLGSLLEHYLPHGRLQPTPQDAIAPEKYQKKDRRYRQLAVAHYWAIHDPYQVYRKYAGLWMCNRRRLSQQITVALTTPVYKNLPDGVKPPRYGWPGYSLHPTHIAQWALKQLKT